MDPLDSGVAPKEDPVKKLERAWEPVPWDPEVWRGKGLKPEVERLMTEGADVFGPDTPGFYEVPQYPFGGWELEQKGGEEADRAIAAGAMEYVPECEVDELLSDCIVHPWLVVHQGSDKYRACQDYKNGTNLFNDALPFNLPSVWSVRRVIKKGSFMAKYDVRDGFWHVPVKPAARRRLLVRHPTNGRLMRAARLPFGYKRSPEHFCLVTQEMADEFHRAASSKHRRPCLRLRRRLHHHRRRRGGVQASLRGVRGAVSRVPHSVGAAQAARADAVHRVLRPPHLQC